jgi:hypothetical protein
MKPSADRASTDFVRAGSADNWRQVADAVPAFTEPVTIAEWWKNRRGESIRLVLSQFQGRSILDLRTWYTAERRPIRLRAEFGTPDFEAEYRAALAEQEIAKGKTSAGNLAG